MNNPLSLVDPSGYESAKSPLEETVSESAGGADEGGDFDASDNAKPTPTPKPKPKPRKTNCGKDSYQRCLPTTTTGTGTHINDRMPDGYCTSCWRRVINLTSGVAAKQQGAATTALDTQSGNEATASTTTTGQSGQKQSTSCAGKPTCIGNVNVNSGDVGREIRDAWNNGVGFLGTIFGVLQFGAVRPDGRWLGQDLKYHPAAWGGNGAVGSRSITQLNKQIAGKLGQYAFAVTTGLSVYNGIKDIRAKNYSDAALDLDDTVMGAIGTSRSPIAFGLSTAYFLGRSSGTFDDAASLINDADEMAQRYAPLMPFGP